jgi:hypothetical protein
MAGMLMLDKSLFAWSILDCPFQMMAVPVSLRQQQQELLLAHLADTEGSFMPERVRELAGAAVEVVRLRAAEIGDPVLVDQVNP